MNEPKPEQIVYVPATVVGREMQHGITTKLTVLVTSANGQAVAVQIPHHDAVDVEDLRSRLRWFSDPINYGVDPAAGHRRIDLYGKRQAEEALALLVSSYPL